MSDFKIEDIIELLEHTNHTIINQVIDIIISSEDCLKDSRVLNKLVSLLASIESTEKVAIALNHCIAEYGIEMISKELNIEIFH